MSVGAYTLSKKFSISTPPEMLIGSILITDSSSLDDSALKRLVLWERRLVGRGREANSVSGSVVKTRGDHSRFPMRMRAIDVRHDAMSELASLDVRTVTLLKTRIIFTV